VKNLRSVFFLSTLSVFVLIACKKINEPTELGRDLIPPIDNVNTFETYLTTVSDNRLSVDTSTISFRDDLALGIINDPEFGTTKGDIYFNVSRPSYGTYPFDSLHTVDSIVLSLSYTGFYGDENAVQNVSVQEIAQGPAFTDTAFYRFNQTPFPTTGVIYGNKSYTAKQLKDSIKIERPRDTTKLANVLRIRLSTSFASSLAANASPTNADTNVYKTDSAFKVKMRGLAVIANSGNSLTYFNTNDNQKTKLIVYYRGTVDGKDSALATEFYHFPAIPPFVSLKPANFRNGQANIIARTPSGAYASYLNNGLQSDDRVFLQTAPSGSYAHIKIPALDAFQNSVIHRAELIATKIPSAADVMFYQPSQLYLDKISENADTAIAFQNDLLSGGELNFQNFGGSFKNGEYRFNVTRHVQGIVTRKERNYPLRLFAPFTITDSVPGTRIPLSLQIVTQPAKGRVVLGGGTFADPTKQLRLRVVYSKI